jgi:hypothetical protein
VSRLLNIQTNLKSLKFGKDRPGGGDSKEPYIQNSIDQNIVPQSEDFLLRGGLGAPLSAADDVVRLGKMFVGTRGIQFIAKQNLLSQTSVRTQASTGVLNEGAYTPLSTLAQAGINFTGIHLNKQGLNPLEGITTYTDVFTSVKGGDTGDSNRLVLLTESKITNTKSVNPITGISPNPTELLSYPGGPGAILGIGTTNIPLPPPNKRTGINNPRIALYSKTNIRLDGNNTNGQPIKLRSDSISNFTAPLLEGETAENGSSIVTSISPSYSDPNKRIEGPGGSRIHMNTPGQRGNIISYTIGKRDSAGNSIGAVDKINAMPIYQSKAIKEDKVNFFKNDLIKFRIAALNNEDPSLKQYMVFRAFISNFSDTYNATWNPVNYVGRGEAFHKYGSFSRGVQMGFTIAAQSKPEIMEQYKKLNFLASNLAPTYSSFGYLGGPLVELTMGGWCYNLPGFITNLTLEIPQESPWEIGINDDGGFDNSVKEMPMICNVGMSFTPIHKFRPEKQVNKYNKAENGEGIVTEYGPQRYLALENGENNNYDTLPTNNESYSDYVNRVNPKTN